MSQFVNKPKKFKVWIDLKEQLHEIKASAPLVSEGDIWWMSMGENIGSEVNGKSGLFSRPGIILKKLSHHFYFIIPKTTQEKHGSWYKSFRHKATDMSACLHQARAIDYRRLSSKIGALDDKDFMEIKTGFHSLYK